MDREFHPHGPHRSFFGSKGCAAKIARIQRCPTPTHSSYHNDAAEGDGGSLGDE